MTELEALSESEIPSIMIQLNAQADIIIL